MIFVSCATKNAGKYCSGGHPEDERFGYVGVGRLVCGSIPEPWARTDNRNNLSCGTGYDHIDLLQRWLFRYRAFNSQMKILVSTLLIQQEGRPPLIHLIDKVDRIR